MPSGIKTSITRRDNIWQDDWVGLSLDALGTGQLSYHMMVNPSGVQLDMLNSVAGNEDPSPDWIWDSAGRLTDTGYAVEIRLPLQSIRFKGGADTRMGMLFWRRVSRSGVSVSWPPLEPGVWVFERHASLRFDDLEPRLAREVLPSATYSRTELRESPARWGAADGRGDVGVSAKVGLTSTITLDATVNPDFSQVESDAFQVEVNQRFPVFFAREAAVLHGRRRHLLARRRGRRRQHAADRRPHAPHRRSDLRREADGQRRPRHVRHADRPSTKRAGASCRRHPGARQESPLQHRRARRYSLGPSNYVGALFTDATLCRHATTASPAPTLRWRRHRNAALRRVRAGLAIARRRRRRHRPAASAPQVELQLLARGKWVAAGIVRALRRRLRDGDGVHQSRRRHRRLGVTSSATSIRTSQAAPWLPALLVRLVHAGRPRSASPAATSSWQVAGVRMRFTRQGFLQRRLHGGLRALGGPALQARPAAAVRRRAAVSAGCRSDGGFSAGHAVFYDPIAPFQGRSRDFNVGTTLQPSGRLSQRSAISASPSTAPTPRERVYTLDIVNTQHDVSVHARARDPRHRAVPTAHASACSPTSSASYEPRPARSSTPATARSSSSATSSTARGCPARGLSHHPARAVLQGVVSVPLLTPARVGVGSESPCQFNGVDREIEIPPRPILGQLQNRSSRVTFTTNARLRSPMPLRARVLLVGPHQEELAARPILPAVAQVAAEGAVACELYCSSALANMRGEKP